VRTIAESWSWSASVPSVALPYRLAPILVLAEESRSSAQPAQQLITRYALVPGNCRQDSRQRADAQRRVGRYDDALARRLIGFERYMAADLMNLAVAPLAAEVPDEVVSGQIARQLDPTATNSSRTR